jgi:hypothetical protein
MVRKVEIEGKEYILHNKDEVAYGAEKHLERAQFAVSLAMLSDKDVEELALKSKKGDTDVNEEEFMDRVLSGKIKTTLLDAHDAAITPEEEAIILSLNISREELMRMPSKVVKRLGVEALEELGTAEDFSEASAIDTN